MPAPRGSASRALGDLLARAAEHERVEQLVGDELARAGVVLGAPRGGDAVAQLGSNPARFSETSDSTDIM